MRVDLWCSLDLDQARRFPFEPRYLKALDGPAPSLMFFAVADRDDRRIPCCCKSAVSHDRKRVDRRQRVTAVVDFGGVWVVQRVRIGREALGRVVLAPKWPCGRRLEESNLRGIRGKYPGFSLGSGGLGD